MNLPSSFCLALLLLLGGCLAVHPLPAQEATPTPAPVATTGSGTDTDPTDTPGSGDDADPGDAPPPIHPI